MSARWGSENVVMEFKDLQAWAMAVDCLGQWTLLAGKRVLALVDISESRHEVKKIQRQSKWEVSCVQWHRHASHVHLFSIATNQRADVCSWAEGQLSQVCTFKAHTRSISDLDWSPFDVNILASCSVDTYTFLWDIRDAKKPIASFQTVAGASQVKWNKITNNLFATTHEGDLRIWDPRKGNSPVQYVAAHLSKIHGLDWSPTSQYHLATSSQDCTVKFWDVTSPRKPEHVLNSSRSPVWRARYTPFGHGLVTVVVPQLRRGENSLLLWNTENIAQPVHKFVGHTDVVLDFHWRKQKTGSKDFQLVTWSKDQSLRIWKIEPQTQKHCGHSISDDGSLTESETVKSVDIRSVVDQPVLSSLILPDSKELSTRAPMITPPPSPSTVQKQTDEKPTSPQQPRTLQQEFSLLNQNITNVTVEEMDAINRTCRVSAFSGKHVVNLMMHFPTSYPANTAPSFQFGLQTTIDKFAQASLLKALKDTALQQVKRHRSCLEPCLRQLIVTLESLLTSDERTTPDSDTPYSNLPVMPNPSSFVPSFIGNFQDSAIPFPRTSGARFCSAGYLVCFTIPGEMKKASGSSSDITPRTLFALSAYAQTHGMRTPLIQAPFALPFTMARSPPNTSNDPVSVSNFYTYKEKRQRPRSRSKQRDISDSKNREGIERMKKLSKVGPLKVYDISALLSVHKQLGENYILDMHDISHMCSHNAAAAAAVGRKDLVQLWSLVDITCSRELSPDPDPDSGPPWAMHPFGRKMIRSLLDFYLSIHDVQTLAMLCCVFWTPRDTMKVLTSYLPKSPSDYVPPIHLTGPYSTPQGDCADASMLVAASMKLRRSNSWSDSFEDYRFVEDAQDPAQIEKEEHDNNCRLLDLSSYPLYDTYKRAYAGILNRWGLRNQSGMIMKYVTQKAEIHTGIEFGVLCQDCGLEVRGPQCTSCKIIPFQCAICRTGVKGASNFCLACGHGGHTLHMMDWFQSHDYCPTGCGCLCLEKNPMTDR